MGEKSNYTLFFKIYEIPFHDNSIIQQNINHKPTLPIHNLYYVIVLLFLLKNLFKTIWVQNPNLFGWKQNQIGTIWCVHHLFYVVHWKTKQQSHWLSFYAVYFYVKTVWYSHKKS